MICDNHGLRDLNQYVNVNDDDGDDAAMEHDFDSKACDYYDYECSGDCFCSDICFAMVRALCS